MKKLFALYLLAQLFSFGSHADDCTLHIDPLFKKYFSASAEAVITEVMTEKGYQLIAPEIGATYNLTASQPFRYYQEDLWSPISYNWILMKNDEDTIQKSGILQNSASHSQKRMTKDLKKNLVRMVPNCR